jgi:hypothetical protein
VKGLLACGFLALVIGMAWGVDPRRAASIAIFVMLGLLVLRWLLAIKLPERRKKRADRVV